MQPLRPSPNAGKAHRQGSHLALSVESMNSSGHSFAASVSFWGTESVDNMSSSVSLDPLVPCTASALLRENLWQIRISL